MVWPSFGWPIVVDVTVGLVVDGASQVSSCVGRSTAPEKASETGRDDTGRRPMGPEEFRWMGLN